MVKAIINEYTENTYIINEKQDAFIIDPGAHFKEIKAYIEDQNLNVKGVLLTHGHFDHLYTLNKVVAAYDCPVYIYEKERDFLFDPNLNLSNTLNRPITLQDKQKVQTLVETDILELGNETIRVLHTPGHTRGSICYKYKRFLFTGDTLFKGTIGRSDLPTSNKSDLQNSLIKIMQKNRDNTLVYPGHGPFTTIVNERMENPYILDLNLE